MWTVWCVIIGIKHGFPCINVCQVPREMLKTEAELPCWFLHALSISIKILVSGHGRQCFIDSFNCKRDASTVLMEYCPESCIWKVKYLCINGTWNSLLIHGFSLVNTRLLKAFGTAFYAIFKHDVNVFPIERIKSGAVWKFVINHVTNARRAHFAPRWRRMLRRRALIFRGLPSNNMY